MYKRPRGIGSWTRATSYAAIALLLIFFALACPGPRLQPMTVVSWGGSTQDGLRNAMISAYEQKYSAKVDEATYNGELELIRDQVQTGNVKWDVVHVEDDMMFKGEKNNWWEALPADWIQTLPLEKRAVDKYGVAFFSWGTVLAYNTDRLKSSGAQPPKDWSAFWDPKYQGPFGFRKSPIGTIEIALLANGTKPSELYPLSREKVEKALSYLTQIRKKISWWTGGAEHQQKLLTDYTLSCAWSGRVWVMMSKGEHVDMTLNQALTRYDWWVIPRGSKHKDEALRFLQLTSQPDVEAKFCSLTGYGPPNDAAMSMLPENLRKYVPNFSTSENPALVMDSRWWADNIDWVQEIWIKWLGE
jgi:putative spermidine/putrescine transport system substrate-binding protein